MINLILQVVLYGCSIMSAIIFVRVWRSVDMLDMETGHDWKGLAVLAIQTMGIVGSFRAGVMIGMSPPQPGSSEQVRLFVFITILLLMMVYSFRAIKQKQV